jgi:hypothetical protein
MVLATLQVDRICAWQTCRNAPIREALMQQYGSAKYEFRRRVTKVVKDIFFFLSCGRLFLFMFAVLIFFLLLLDYFSVQDARRKYSIVL